MSAVRLFAACVAIWGSTWYAITFQLGTVAPEVSVLYRYVLAASLLFAFCLARGLPLRFAPAAHGWMALQGILSYSISYVCVYYAEHYLVSGLVAVGYSASPLLNMAGMRAFFGAPMTRRVTAGALLGIAGITLVFWPEFAHLQAERRVAVGVAFTAAGVILASLASLVAHRNHEAGIPLWQNLAWGMFYGAISTLAIVLARGGEFVFPVTVPYVGSLFYLAILGSILAFASYLQLLAKVGPARAGYIGVMVPVMALLVSSVFEGYRWSVLALAGVAVSVAGNVIILRQPKSA